MPRGYCTLRRLRIRQQHCLQQHRARACRRTLLVIAVVLIECRQIQRMRERPTQQPRFQHPRQQPWTRPTNLYRAIARSLALVAARQQDQGRFFYSFVRHRMELCRAFDIFADYFQFVLMDESSDDDFSTIWTDKALDRMLAVGDTSVCSGTLRNVTVAVEIRVSQSEPAIDLAAYDYAASASLHVPSGRLVVMGCTDYLPDASCIEVPAGTYELLYLATGLDTITSESDPAQDRYIVYLWPGRLREPVLLKHWRSGA